MENNQNFKDLVHIEHWQKLQDLFSTVTELGLRTLDYKGDLLTKPSGEPKLCRQLRKNHQLNIQVCEKCLPTFLGGKEIVDLNLSFSCHSGLHNYLIPLKLENRVLAYVVIGPLILVARKAKEEYRNVAERLGMELSDFWGSLLDIRVVSFQRIQTIIELWGAFSGYILGTAYQNKSIEDQVSEIKSSESTDINSLLKVFLEMALQVSGADIGSIMLLKKDADELTIRASKGIPEEVVKNAKVKLGEGISGTAAKEDRPILIDDNLGDNRIKRYLNRPYIQSSMIVPIKVENNVLGVMNLGALDISPVRFNTENLGRMTQLTNLATLALHASIR